MDNSRIKNIFIIVLVLVNAFLTVLVIQDREAAKQGKNAVKSGIMSVYAKKNIEIDESVDIYGYGSSVWALNPDKAAFEQFSEKVIGTISERQSTSDGLLLTGSGGKALLASAGDFTINLTAGRKAESSLENAAVSIASELGIQVDSNTLKTQIREGTDVVTMRCVTEGMPVFNCTVRFVFTGGTLYEIKGDAPDLYTKEKSDTEVLDAATILASFLDIISSASTKIETLEQGYAVSHPGDGSVVMTPVWRIETDAETCYLNGVTGERVAINSF